MEIVVQPRLQEVLMQVRAKQQGERENCPELSPTHLRGTPSEVFFGLIKEAAPPPKFFVGWRTVASSVALCLEHALNLMKVPTPGAQKWLEQAKELAREAAFPENTNLAESLDAVKGLTCKHPQWVALFKAPAKNDNFYFACLGLLLLDALPKGKLISKQVVQALNKQPKEADSLELLRQVLRLPHQDVFAVVGWERSLNKLWPSLQLRYDVGGSGDEFGERTVQETQQKELLHRVRFASPKHRGGILDHRHLSAVEIKNLGPQLEAMLHSSSVQSQRAASAMLAWQAPFALHHLSRVALLGHGSQEWTMCLDLERGLWLTNIECIAPEQHTKLDSDGHFEACMVSAKPLPRSLHSYLVSRFESGMTCVGDLLPILPSIDSADSVLPSSRQIVPSFARWINSSGVFMRLLEIDGLIAAVLSNDFGMVAKSKLYYTVVMPQELWTASQSLYAQLGWSDPVSMPEGLMAVGANAVPTDQRVQQVFQWLEQWVESARPSNRSSLESVLEFHNRYASAVAWLIGFATSARRVSQVEWSAQSLHEGCNALVLDDKKVMDLPGGLPVPLPSLMQEQLHLYYKHLGALEGRLRHQAGYFRSHVSPWLQSVIARQNQRLFRSISPKGKLGDISTHSLVKELPDTCQVAPDCGRKFWETTLRHSGICTSHIDAFLRHEVLGQERFSSASDFQPNAALEHLRRQIDHHLQRLSVRGLKGFRS